ncbi:MAG: hypothetical protein LBJ17_07525 [Dysgonamonadaceae bacterium]|jgi:hypothetical protein|nr:hypothetical protein [Dysgonamonadaceae bacterium]
MKTILYTITALFILSATGAQAQVTIGSLEKAQEFSILELEGNGERGMRLPQLTAGQREALQQTFGEKATAEALGLQIFNTTTGCVETWNGTEWILQCACGSQPCPQPNNSENIPEEQPEWNENFRWVGAFWRDDQTGERVIASNVSDASVQWTASVDDPETNGQWLNLDDNGGYDPNLWTDNPGDAEDNQLPAVRKTEVSGTGTIMFRIGVTGEDDRQDNNAYLTPDGWGKPPRYATITLTVGNKDFKIYCRQGEAADYLFTKNETYRENTYRSKAVMFSPYNLTNKLLSETVTMAETGTAANLDTYNGAFVDYPTKGGAFFQWANETHPTYAYHPTTPANFDETTWINNSSNTDYWNNLAATNETCPSGWRRPTDGITNGMQEYGDGIDNIANSEMRQSLYSVPPNGSTNSTSDHVVGYYADGYFDRRQITNSANGITATANSTVSKDTKDAAYIGFLFFNAANDNRSLFMPLCGTRAYNSGNSRFGIISGLGSSSSYFSSTAYNSDEISGFVWNLYLQKNNSVVRQAQNSRRCTGFSIRCVVHEDEPI